MRGINISRSMGLNNEKSTPLFSLLLFRTICDRLKKFRDEELYNVQNPEIKQFRMIAEQEME